jgi:type II secretory pathway component PulF
MARISTGHLAQLCHRVGTGLRAGVDVRRLWEQESRRGGPMQARYLAHVHQRVSAGDTMAEAMRGCHGFFPSLTCELVDVGEHTGKLDTVFLELASHYQHLLALRRQFLVAIAWPAIQLVAAIGIIGFFIWLSGILTAGSNTGFAPLGLSGNSGLMIYMTVVIGLAGTVTAAVLAVTRGWLGPLPMMLALQVPLIGSCLRTFALSRLAWTLSMTLDAGVDARRSMRLAILSTQNPYYMAPLRQVDNAILHGSEFHVALRETGLFPRDFLEDLAAAEIAGTHAESMALVAQQYQDRARTASRIITMVASFAIWGLVAMMIVFMIFSLAAQILRPYQEALDFYNESMR